MTETASTDLGSVIQVRHVMTPVGLIRPVHEKDSADAVCERMLAKNYHATTVLRGGRVIGWVTRDDLAKHSGEQVRSVLREPTADVLIGAGSAVGALLERFREFNFLLVVGDSGIEGIATPSDMGRQAGRMHLFMQICALELAVAALARKHDDLKTVIEQGLTRENQRKVAARLRNRIKLGGVADIIAVLDFVDLLRIGQVLVPKWAEVESSQLEGLNRFRHSVVHSPNEVADDGSVEIKIVILNLDLVHRLISAM